MMCGLSSVWEGEDERAKNLEQNSASMSQSSMNVDHNQS